MSPENNQLPPELTPEQMQMPGYKTDALGEARNQFRQEVAPALEAVKNEIHLREKQVDFLRRRLDTYKQQLEVVKEGLDLFKDDNLGLDYELQKKILDQQIQGIEEYIAGIEDDRRKVEETGRGIQQSAMEKGDNLQEARDVTLALMDLRDEWKKDREAMQRRHGTRMSILAGTKSENNNAVKAYTEQSLRQIDELNARYGLAEKGLVDRLKALSPDSTEQYSPTSSPVEASPDQGGGGGNGEAIPLAEADASTDATQETAQAADITQETAQAAETTAEVNVDVPTIPEQEQATEASTDIRDRVEVQAVTGTNDEATLPDASATVTQKVSTTEPTLPPNLFGVRRDVAEVPTTEDDEKKRQRNETARRNVNELSVLLGIPDSLVREAIKTFLGSRSASEGNIEADEFVVGIVAELSLNTANRLGLKPNGGESAEAFLTRVNEASIREGMSFMDKVREKIPAINVKLPEFKMPFGSTPEQKRTAIEARQAAVKARIEDIKKYIVGGDYPEAYANGLRTTLSQEQQGDLRRKYQAEQTSLEGQLADLEKQLADLRAAEGAGGGGETEKRSWKMPGTELFRWFKDKYNARQDRIQAEKTSAEVADFRQNLENRLMRFYDVNKSITGLREVDTQQKHVIFAENVRIIATLANELKTNGRARLQTEMQVPFIAANGTLQLENVSRNATTEQFQATLKELLKRTTDGINMERMIAYEEAKQAVDQANSLLQ